MCLKSTLGVIASRNSSLYNRGKCLCSHPCNFLSRTRNNSRYNQCGIPS